MEIFKIKTPGPYSTVQDGGRYGYQKFGIPPTGALDDFAYKAANLLVGNPEGAAVVESTVLGPEIEIMEEVDLAVTGAEAAVTLNNKSVPGWSSIRAKAGDSLKVGPVKTGCRSYLAVSGGIDVPLVMGSRSCYVGAKIGGYKGRILAKGDVLSRGEGALLERSRRMPGKYIPHHEKEIVLRAVPGPQDDFFDTGLEDFFGSEFIVSTNANRMGYRLEGPRILHKEGAAKSIISEPSLSGGVQIPPDGQAIILLVEQTVGGYTKIATVISTDINRVAQAMPGHKIRFEKTSLENAHRIYRNHQAHLLTIRQLLEDRS
jgi:antagonist of KipI